MRLRGILAVKVAAALFGAVAVWQLGAGGYIHAKAALAQYLVGDAWARTLAGETRAKPWNWADTWPVARLRVPAHGIDLFVLAGAQGRTLAFGPGHLDGTAAPGMTGNSVVAGHRDTSFAFLKDLAVGEEVQVRRADGRWVAYQVTAHQIVDSRKTWLAAGTTGRMLTLVTCFPFDAVTPGGPLRYVVTAEAG